MRIVLGNQNGINSFYKTYKNNINSIILTLLLFIIGEMLVSNFLSIKQLMLTVKLASFIALFGLCQMVVISAGGSGLDLSIGYTATMSAVFAARIMDGKNETIIIAIFVAIAIGVIVGLINGILTSYIKLPPLVVTLAMANILQGAIDVYTKGSNITGKPSPLFRTIAAKSSGIFPNIFFVLLIVTVIVMIILKRTKYGVNLYGVGTNETTAYLCGINVKKVRCLTYIISGVIAALVGLLLLGNMGMAFKDMGSNYIMPSIAAVVVGGIALKGGEGDYIGVVLGAIFLQTLTNILVALGWGDAGKWLGFGVVLFVLLIVYVSNRRNR